MKNIRFFFLSEKFHCLVIKCLVYLIWHVFVMKYETTKFLNPFKKYLPGDSLDLWLPTECPA